MADIIKSLESAKNLEERAVILKENIEKNKQRIEKRNGCIILDIDEHKGLHIGDKVEYIAAAFGKPDGKPCIGYISHFYTNNDQDIDVGITTPNGSYSTHNRRSLPRKLA